MMIALIAERSIVKTEFHINANIVHSLCEMWGKSDARVSLIRYRGQSRSIVNSYMDMRSDWNEGVRTGCEAQI